MASPRILIVRAPGTNCDQETASAFSAAGGNAEVVHINRLREDPHSIHAYQILCFPGGFSYGDDIAAGKIVAVLLRHHLQEAIDRFRGEGKLILGICNGFQILLKSGLLLPNVDGSPQATLSWNDSGQFEDRWVWLQIAPSRSPFLADITRLYLPVAHAEGRFVARDGATLKRLADQGQLAIRYAAPADCSTSSAAETVVADDGGRLPFPWNPNGSQANVAGLTSEDGHVLGLMPHPERFVDPTHHPRWTRGQWHEPGHGVAMFVNAVRFFQ